MQQDYKMQLSSSEIYSLLSPLKVGTQKHGAHKAS